MTANTHLRTTLARVLTNSTNYPQPDRLLGRDLSKLIDAATDAVVEGGYVKMEYGVTAQAELLELLLKLDEAHKPEGAMWPELAQGIVAAGYTKMEETK